MVFEVLAFAFGIVEIEERDFYFEISPEDYQDEEANIRNNKKA